MVRKASSAAPLDPPPGYAIDPNAPPMLRYQASLPNLPVPPLESTAAKYLETVKPLLTPAEFSKTKAAVDEFVASPHAAELQKLLQKRATQEGRDNWLSDWWNDVAYMAYRDPVVVFVSYFFVHVDDAVKSRARDQAKRAASLIKAMLPFRELTERCAPNKHGCFLCLYLPQRPTRAREGSGQPTLHVLVQVALPLFPIPYQTFRHRAKVRCKNPQSHCCHSQEQVLRRSPHQHTRPGSLLRRAGSVRSYSVISPRVLVLIIRSVNSTKSSRLRAQRPAKSLSVPSPLTIATCGPRTAPNSSLPPPRMLHSSRRSRAP